MSVADIKPWFQNDVADMIRSVYYAMKTGLKRKQIPQADKDKQWSGALDAWASVLLARGVNPADVFDQEDIEFMSKMNKG